MSAAVLVREPMTTTRDATTVGIANVLRSEWTKLRSLRSTKACGLLVVLAMLGIAIAMGARWAYEIKHDPPGKLGDFDSTNVILSGVYLAQVVVGAIGVLAIASEYTTGMIRPTFSAVPQRHVVLAAKALVLAGVTLVIGEVMSFVSFLVGENFLSGTVHHASLSDPTVLRAVIGAGLYLPAVALLGFGLGAVFRNTAAALSAFFGILFALTVLADLLPTSLRNAVIDYLPANSGSQIFTTVPTHDALAPWTGFGVFSLYAVVALVAGFVIVSRRDA
jgi:ABC-2 type transport system permease protein